jgi:lysophospholipase L1-like esterase
MTAMQPIKKRHFGRAAVLFAVCATTALATGDFNRRPWAGLECQAQAGLPPKGEPTNADEAAAKKAKADAELEAKYQAWVATLSSAQQAWERTLQENLGSFYLPIHKREKLAGKSNAWDFVADDPKLPRVLLIGDSVSRGYTQAVRKELNGKVNVHRAPANCGPTAAGLKSLEVWLGDGNWDLIHFNFGIHDRATPIADYTQRLGQLMARLKKTGARLVWASTTPIPDDLSKKQTAASIVERNQAAAELMKKQGVAINDLFAAVTPRLAEMQPPNDVHFNAKGYEFLGSRVAEAIQAALKLPSNVQTVQ